MKRKLIDRILDLLYPPRCMICACFLEPGTGPVCAGCLQTLPEHDGADPAVADAAQCVATFFYEGAMRESILRYKFENRPWYAAQYGAWMAATVRDKLLGKFDLISWVPVSRERRRRRGYDQAELLARALAEALGAKPPVRALEKHADNPAQSGLTDASQRVANVSGVYRAVEQKHFAGKRILLIDDIVTTGATLSECARVLKAAGAAEVVCAALATPRET